MTQEEKELLLRDISARLRYGVKFKSEQDVNPLEIHYIKDEEVYTRQFKNLPYWIESIKPYLRPLSSMTKEEKAYYFAIDEEPVKCIDWLNEHHFDYRGLIEKGLALEAPEDMYKQ